MDINNDKNIEEQINIEQSNVYGNSNQPIEIAILAAGTIGILGAISGFLVGNSTKKIDENDDKKHIEYHETNLNSYIGLKFFQPKFWGNYHTINCNLDICNLETFVKIFFFIGNIYYNQYYPLFFSRIDKIRWYDYCFFQNHNIKDTNFILGDFNSNNFIRTNFIICVTNIEHNSVKKLDNRIYTIDDIGKNCTKFFDFRIG